MPLKKIFATERIVSITKTFVKDLTVYDLGIENEHNYNAGGIAVHNCITEANYIFNNAYIKMQEEGAYVVGLSMPDACGFCAEEINGRVYKVRKDIPPDYRDMKGKEYEKWAKVWETEIWVGKNNYGRSTSSRKRIDKNIGNKESNLTEKEHHEFSMAVIPAHPICHCRWVHINEKTMWIDEHRQMKSRVEDEDKWQEWYENRIEN